ncbi:MAG TPA: hypothetical protein DCL21_03815 [Alphaproteobacteria bacterium]|nr:hypothetical protein [Alphaproteobacteria bacterium]
MLKKLLKQNIKTKGLQIKPGLKAASLDIAQISDINSLVYPLEDAKLNTYIPTVSIGDKVKKGQVIAEAENAHGLKILAALDGVIETIDEVKAPLPQKITPALIIKPDNKKYWFDDVFFNIDVKLDEYPKEMIFEKIVQANIQGLGGGLFLSAKKILGSNIEHIVLNAVECEPILNCDEAVLYNYLAEVLAGGIFLKNAAKAKTITIVLKENKKDLINHISHFVKNNEQFNGINLATVPDLYPSGAEKEILKHVFNTKLTSAQHATDHGFLMQNVMTCVSIFRAVTCDLPQLERVFSVFGKNIESPTNLVAPIGVTVEDILAFLKIDSNKVDSIRIGGLMMGEDIVKGTSRKHSALLKSSNGIILNTYEDKEVSECINCGECVKACPVDLVPNKMFKAAQADDFNSSYLKNLSECMNCNLCNYVCPSNIDLVGMFKYAKQQKAMIQEEQKRAEYINNLTQKKIERTKFEKQEKERIKQERKLARQKRLEEKQKKEQETNETTA